MRAVLAAIVLIVSASFALAAKGWPGPYPVTLVKVTDGDTIMVRFRVGPCGRGPCKNSVWSIRVAGVDTPESRLCRDWSIIAKLPPAERSKRQSCAWCPAEKQVAKEAKAYVGKLLATREIRVSGLVKDPYWGRLVGVVEFRADEAWRSLADVLVDVGYAVEYDPGDGNYTKDKPWCSHLSGGER